MDAVLLSLLTKAPVVPPQEEDAAEGQELLSDSNPFGEMLSSAIKLDTDPVVNEEVAEIPDLKTIEEILDLLVVDLHDVSLEEIPQQIMSQIRASGLSDVLGTSLDYMAVPIANVATASEVISIPDTTQLSDKEGEVDFLLLTPTQEEISGYPILLPINEEMSEQITDNLDDAGDLIQDLMVDFDLPWGAEQAVPNYDVYMISVDPHAVSEEVADVVSTLPELAIYHKDMMHSLGGQRLPAEEIHPLTRQPLTTVPYSDDVLNMAQGASEDADSFETILLSKVNAKPQDIAGQAHQANMQAQANADAKAQAAAHMASFASADAEEIFVNVGTQSQTSQQAFASATASAMGTAEADVEILPPVNSSSSSLSFSAIESDRAQVPVFKTVQFIPQHMTKIPHAGEQVQMFIRQGMQADMDHIVLQLEPRDLGRVEMRMDVGHDGRAHVSFVAENKDTLDMLQRDARLLEKALQEAGLDADSGEMEFNLSEGSDRDAEESDEFGTPLASDDSDEGVKESYVAQYTVNFEEGVDIKV